METLVATLTCSIAVAACVERLLHARDARWSLPPLAVAIAAWAWMWTVRTPTAGRALLAFSIADLAVLAIGVVAVLRLLGGFAAEPGPADDDGGDGDGDPAPVAPWDPPALAATAAPRRPLPRHDVPPRNRRRQDHRRRRPTKV